MTSRSRFAAGICMAVAIAFIALGYSVISRAQGSGHAIHLKSYEFTPGFGQQPLIPPGLMIAEYAQDQRGYYLVQFRGPVEQSWKDGLTALGAEILDYVPDFAFKVRMNPAQARRAGDLASIVWVGIFEPAYKLSPDLIRNGTQIYVVKAESGADHGLVHAAVAATGAQILSRNEGILTVAADPDQVDAIARVLDVAWVENYKMWKLHNEYAGGIIMGAATANTHGYDGSSQTVAVADTGLGDGTATGGHADLASRTTAIYNWPGSAGGCFASVSDDGAKDVSSGHGTHTTVSAVGASARYGRGVAPGASLVFQALENYVTINFLCTFLYGYQNGYYLTGVPGDLNQLYQQAYTAGARIHSNSWGASGAGVYDTNSVNTDSFVWNHRDMVVTFSAGNDGKDANSDGIIDSGSIASPGTAKNVITVGASENDRQHDYPCDTALNYTDCGARDGSNESLIVTYGVGFGFPANPWKDDPIVGDAEQMTAFSSRGPTQDGRIKPDVAAPGTYVLSGYSNMFQQFYGSGPNPVDGNYQYDGWADPESRYHKYFGGTSMSNPLVAGGAAVVRDYYAKAKGISASAALVKATIINSAHDLLDEDNSGTYANHLPIPNIHEGWGRVDLAAATDGSATFYDVAPGIGTNGTASYTFTATAEGPLKISLVWSDYPSTTAASINLVNDLDLIVTDPIAATYKGNVFSGGWSQTGGSEDRRNNVENVYIQIPASGIYTIAVKGFNVPNGPQPYALVIRQPSNAPPPPSGNQDPQATFTGAPGTAAYKSTFTVSSTTLSSSQPVYTASGACTNSGTNYTMTSGTGTCTSTVTWGADETYKGATLSQSTTATKINPTTSFTGAPETAPNYSTFTVSSTTNSSASPVYTSSGACTNNGAVYTMTSDSGTCTSTVTWAADNNYNGATRSQTTTATPGSPPAKTVHVGNLTAASSSGGSYWVAGVSTLVHDANHNTVAGAKVTATWSSGSKTSGSCTTTTGGFCTITSGRITNTSATVNFTVTGISKKGYTYNPAANHDTTGDSDGTTMVVKKP